jgi:hypothetical protein
MNARRARVLRMSLIFSFSCSTSLSLDTTIENTNDFAQKDGSIQIGPITSSQPVNLHGRYLGNGHTSSRGWMNHDVREGSECWGGIMDVVGGKTASPARRIGLGYISSRRLVDNLFRCGMRLMSGSERADAVRSRGGCQAII